MRDEDERPVYRYATLGYRAAASFQIALIQSARVVDVVATKRSRGHT